MKKLVDQKTIREWHRVANRKRRRITPRQLAKAYERYCREVACSMPSPKKVRAAARRRKIADRRARRAAERAKLAAQVRPVFE